MSDSDPELFVFCRRVSLFQIHLFVSFQKCLQFCLHVFSSSTEIMAKKEGIGFLISDTNPNDLLCWLVTRRKYRSVSVAAVESGCAPYFEEQEAPIFSPLSLLPPRHYSITTLPSSIAPLPPLPPPPSLYKQFWPKPKLPLQHFAVKLAFRVWTRSGPGPPLATSSSACICIYKVLQNHVHTVGRYQNSSKSSTTQLNILIFQTTHQKCKAQTLVMSYIFSLTGSSGPSPVRRCC